MKILLALSLVLLTTGCAKIAPITPYSLYTLPFDALATLEDFCEDPIEDAQTLTPLEERAIYGKVIQTNSTPGTSCSSTRSKT